MSLVQLINIYCTIFVKYLKIRQYDNYLKNINLTINNIYI